MSNRTQTAQDGKPMLVTQYVGGDMKPDKETTAQTNRRSGDLDESANNPQEVIESRDSAPYSVHVGGVANDKHAVSGSAKTSDSGGFDHERKTEHQASSEKGHSRGLSEKSKVEKGHDRQSHRQNEGEHHKDSAKESHREDEHSHDKGGATQQGIRERTEIEYYEREHFLDTDYDKEKEGHAKTSGVKEHEKHSDHDSHDRTREHITHGSKGSEHDKKSSVSEEHKNVRPVHYSPPYGAHYKGAVGYGAHHKGAEAHEAASLDAHKEHSAHSEKNAASSKGLKEHNHEKDHHSKQEDSGYRDSDKGRRKEGYRERGYKITAEREYFLNDAHHDTGHGKHRSGERTRDREGVRHGNKEGERDRGFLKEHKSHDSHDAAYDAKERKYHDGEKHAEGFSKTAASESAEEKKQKHNHHEESPSVVYLQDGPPVIRQPPIPLYPHPVAYETAIESKNPVITHPSPRNQGSYRKHRHVPDKTVETGDHDTYEDIPEARDNDERQGYVGYASYKRKKPSTPILANIRQNIRSTVTASPPSYTKSQPKGEPVKFPEERNSGEEDAHVRQYGSHLDSPQNLARPTAAPEPAYASAPKNDDKRYSKPKPILDLAYPIVNPKPERHRSSAIQQKYRHYADYPDRANSKSKIYVDPDYGYDYPHLDEKQIVPGISVIYRRPQGRQSRVYAQPIQNNQQTANSNNNNNNSKKISYSPVVLLTSGPSNDNQAVDVWYTRRT